MNSSLWIIIAFTVNLTEGTNVIIWSQPSKRISGHKNEMKMVLLLNYFKSLLRSHREVLFDRLDFVCDSQANGFTEEIRFKLHFAFEFIISILALIVGTVGLHFESSTLAERTFNLEYILLSSGYTFSHQIFPKIVWLVADVIILLGSTDLLLNSLYSIYAKGFNDKFRMIHLSHQNRLKIGTKGKWILADCLFLVVEFIFDRIEHRRFQEDSNIPSKGQKCSYETIEGNLLHFDDFLLRNASVQFNVQNIDLFTVLLVVFVLCLYFLFDLW